MKGAKPQLVVDNAPIDTIPKPPVYFNDYAKAEWARVMPIVVERQLVNDADMGQVENYCIAQGAVREFQDMMAKALGPDTKAKHFRAMNQAITTAGRLAAELGLTPTSRARSTRKPKAGDDGENPLDIR